MTSLVSVAESLRRNKVAIFDRLSSKTIVGILLFVLLVTGCKSDRSTQDTITISPLPHTTDLDISPIPTPDDITADPNQEQRPTNVSPGKGAIIGTVLIENNKKLTRSIRAFLAPFYWNDSKTQGVFVLDPDRAVSVPIAHSGLFKFIDVKPGYYVVLIGETPATAVAILGDNNQAHVIEVGADQIIDLGEQRVNLP